MKYMSKYRPKFESNCSDISLQLNALLPCSTKLCSTYHIITSDQVVHAYTVELVLNSCTSLWSLLRVPEWYWDLRVWLGDDKLYLYENQKNEIWGDECGVTWKCVPQTDACAACMCNQHNHDFCHDLHVKQVLIYALCFLPILPFRFFKSSSI